MDPAMAGAIGGGLVVAALGLAFALLAYGRSTRQPELDALQGSNDDLRATLSAERKRERIRAAGAELDHQRAIALAAGVGAGDLDRVLLQFPRVGPDGTPGEPGNETDAGDGEDAEGAG